MKISKTWRDKNDDLVSECPYCGCEQIEEKRFVVGDLSRCAYEECFKRYKIGDPDKLKKDQLIIDLESRLRKIDVMIKNMQEDTDRSWLLAELLILEEKIKPLLNGGVDTIRKIRELL